ncbi:hypothetical protein WA026_000048 [Henosepilachna vigintioctopunctata]
MQPKSVIVNLKGSIDNVQKNSEDILPLENINLSVPLNEDVLQLVESTNVCNETLQGNLTSYTDEQSRYVDFYPDCNNTVLRHSTNIENLNLEINLYTEQDFNYDYNHKVNESIDLTETNCTEYFNSQQTELTFASFPNQVNTENSITTTNQCVETSLQNDNVSKCKPKETLISVDAVRRKLNLEATEVPLQKKAKKQFKCPYCERVFVRRISLNSHIALHTKAKPFSCTTCGKSFPVKSELTIHKRIHSDQYQCTICLKTFIVPSKLERHIRTHTKERPFKCNYENCGKSFSDQSNLAEHENTHLKTKNFKCTKCERCFKTKSQLKSHKLTHISGVSYTCDICKKSYKYKTNLIFHIKTHNGFKCPYCNLGCEKLKHLVKHRKECNMKLCKSEG